MKRDRPLELFNHNAEAEPPATRKRGAAMRDRPPAPRHPEPDPGQYGAGHGSHDGPVKEASSARGLKVAKSYRRAKRNVFADREVFITERLARNESMVADLQSFLFTAPPPSATPFLATRPEALLDRMAAIDTLAAIASLRPTDTDARDAVEALVAVARGQGEVIEDSTSRRAGLGERFDALSALARIDLARATAVVAEVNGSRQRDYLTRGIERGLFGGGLTAAAARHAIAVAAQGR